MTEIKLTEEPLRSELKNKRASKFSCASSCGENDLSDYNPYNMVV